MPWYMQEPCQTEKNLQKSIKKSRSIAGLQLPLTDRAYVDKLLFMVLPVDSELSLEVFLILCIYDTKNFANKQKNVTFFQKKLYRTIYI